MASKIMLNDDAYYGAPKAFMIPEGNINTDVVSNNQLEWYLTPNSYNNFTYYALLSGQLVNLESNEKYVIGKVYTNYMYGQNIQVKQSDVTPINPKQAVTRLEVLRKTEDNGPLFIDLTNCWSTIKQYKYFKLMFYDNDNIEFSQVTMETKNLPYISAIDVVRHDSTYDSSYGTFNLKVENNKIYGVQNDGAGYAYMYLSDNQKALDDFIEARP